MKRFGLSRELLRESDDALRTILGLLDDVAPVPADGMSSALDIHLALGALEDLYADESAAPAHGDPGRFRRVVRSVAHLGQRAAGGS